MVLCLPLLQILNLKEEIAWNCILRNCMSTMYFGLTWVEGWVQSSKILQTGGVWGQHRTGDRSPESRVGCKTCLKTKSRWRRMRWFPFPSWQRGRFCVAVSDVSRRLAASVPASNSSRRRLAFRFALPLLLVFACNKKTQLSFRDWYR
jgi:hypothetical protein